ncbi:TetR/AcrR family transcriptional regulator [Umezawaea sp. Da 62-37]|uniref:TetR/AcrR family transcriptional regulator n=1 Tax=Umezawaea sp. Da 62-37 TaxID=3075927 RepID=UPI0028F6C818|nr:TetR/AcrR family transcriptional regulator [Umezawaea sp. Da 62-37]WNV85344.1 TetR/AcrR family transcriptional regulator [Umezawaea sp. Da 62-37]
MTESASGTTGGRGARERILTAAAALFYEQGINATGIKQLTDAAHVSTRTLYQHFASKDDVVAAYLERWDTKRSLPNEAALHDPDQPPLTRLLGLFADPQAGSPARGCPFHNAAVEVADGESPVRRLVSAHKQHVLRLIVQAATEADLTGPEQLGHQLAVLYEGATAWHTSTGDQAAFTHARTTASTLLRLADPVNATPTTTDGKDPGDH